MAKNWIAGAIKHPGALHKQLGVAAGDKIPAKKMSAARSGKYGALAERRAHLAKTLSSFHTGGTVMEDGAYNLKKGEVVHAPVMPEGEHCCQESPNSLAMRLKLKRFDW